MSNRRARGIFVAVLAALMPLVLQGAVTITIINGDPGGVGFNDATPVAQVGGNTGTTLGQQRLNAFQAAATKWGSTLNSNVTVRIHAVWTALSCNANSAVLGSAGAAYIFRDFTNAPVGGHWYPKALANALKGSDLDNTNEDIDANFNVNLGNSGCLTGVHFYLGLDNNHGGDIDLVAVLTHEFGHGLGFQTFTDGSNGAQESGFPSIWDDFLLDTTTNKTWTMMNASERQASAINNGKLVWNGGNVTASVPQVLQASGPSFVGADANGRALMFAPATYQPGSSVSHYDTSASPNQLMEPTYTADETHQVAPPQDLTYPLLKDIGWTGSVVTPVSITVTTNPVGLQVTVDSTAYTSPHTFSWTPGTSHTINTASPQTLGNARELFASWSDSGAQSHTVTAPSGTTTYTANFTTQYLLTRNVFPLSGGSLNATPSSGDGYYATGSSVQLAAVANSGCTFTGFTGDLTGTTNPQSVSMTAPRSVTANFSCTSGNPTALQLVPLTPCRIMDSRTGQGFSGAFGPPSLAAGGTRDVPITSGGCNIPSTAKAYSLNITVLPKAGFLAFLAVWPTGQPQPLVSTLNSWDGSTIANAALVPAGTNGSISVYASNIADVVIDINGYFAPPGGSSLAFYPLTPCRVMDTRNAAGTFGGPLISGGTSRSLPVTASPCGAPSSARAFSLNVTAVPKGPLYYITAWPTGQPQPNASTLNSFDGSVLANAAIVPAGTNGSVSFYASQDTDLVVDINGYFAAPGTGGLNFYTTTPCRIADTRNATGTFGGPMLAAGVGRSFPVPQSSCGLPSNAGAYSMNMTVVPPGPLFYLTVWPTGLAQPFVSTLNDFKGLAVANAALLPAGTAGAVSGWVSNNSDLIIDVNGYFSQ